MSTEGTGLVSYYFEKMVGTLTALIIPASLFILIIPGLVIRIVAGPDYLEAIPILQVTMLFSFLRPFFTQFGYTMDSIGKPQINFRVNMFFLIVSLIFHFHEYQMVWKPDGCGVRQQFYHGIRLYCILFHPSK